MVSAAFFHDHRFYNFNNKYYATNLSDEVWEKRYLPYFDRLIVTGRLIRSEEGSDRRSKSSTAGVEFNCIEQSGTSIELFLDSPHMRKVIRSSLDRVDCAVIRLPSFIGDIALQECKKGDIPYLVELVSCPWDALMNHGMQGKLVGPFETLKTKRNVWNAPFVEYVTEEFLQKRYPTKGRSAGCSDVVLPPVDERLISDRIDYLDSRAFGEFKFGTIGALDVPYKGQGRVLNAIAIHRRSGSQKKWKYEMVGGGSPRRIEAASRKLGISDDVTIVGQLTHEQVIGWLDTLDFYIQPSLVEALPRAVVEAMSRGLLVVGTDVGGIPELLEEEYVVKSDKNAPREICHLIESLDRSELKRAAVRNYEEALKYSSDLLRLKHESLMNEFVEYVMDEERNERK